MWPQVFKIGKIPVNSYGLMIVIGFLLGLYVGKRRIRRLGLEDHFSDFAMTMLLSGIIGGRIFYYFQYYESHFAGESFLEFFKIWNGGLVFYGGAIGGIVGAVVLILWKKLPGADYLDVASLVAPIAMGFGRLGCFLNGCCFGRQCQEDFALAVQFPDGSPAATKHTLLRNIAAGQESLPVHPAQLYQASHDFLMFFLLWLFFRLARPPRGSGMAMALILYGTGRFFLEGLRGDHELTFSGLTVSQNLSIGLAAISAIALVFLYRKRYLTMKPEGGERG